MECGDDFDDDGDDADDKDDKPDGERDDDDDDADDTYDRLVILSTTESNMMRMTSQSLSEPLCDS